MPALLDLTWKPSASEPELPTTGYPYKAPAIYRGDSYSITLTLTEDAAPYEPEGDLYAQIRTARLGVGSAAPDDPLLEFEVTVTVNEVVISLTSDQTIDVPDSCYWDLQERLDADTARTWFTGKVKGWGDITREEAGS
jgi:hypothetical protein